MSLVSGIVVYLLVWWMTLFCVLPIGVVPHQEENIGTAGSAPKNANMKFKFLLTTGISAVIWGVVYILIDMEIINFYQVADDMWQDDAVSVAQ